MKTIGLLQVCKIRETSCSLLSFLLSYSKRKIGIVKKYGAGPQREKSDIGLTLGFGNQLTTGRKRINPSPPLPFPGVRIGSSS